MAETEKDFYLTTSDNPFNYFTQYDQWLRYDTDYGYNTNCLVARIAPTSIGIPDEINDDMIGIAIENFLELALPMINSDGKEVHYMKCYEP